MKKLIEYGWDVPYPDFVREHIREMERRPFDGLIFRLRDYNHAFDPRPWQEADLQPQFEALKGIEWKAFTDNFLCLYAANRWDMDWFNDDQWKHILANLRLTTKAAKIGNCVGVCFDPEPYGSNPWAYPGTYRERTFAEMGAQVRQRGAQFITALQEEMPDLRLLTFFQLSLFTHLMDEPDPKRLEERLSRNHYALLPAFLNGMLDAIAPDVRIIDGNEGSYYYDSDDDYLRAYHAMKQRAQSLIAPESRLKYQAHVLQAGMALYMDHVLALRQPEGAYVSHYLEPDERRQWFEHNVYWALKTADEYVWCYSERMNWWKDQVPEGAENAIRSAREKVEQGKPLGFDIASLVSRGKQKMDAALASRIVQRSATIQPLPPDEKPPRIDGDLNEAIWQDREPLEPFLPTASSFRDIEAATIAWVTYDDDALYVAFRCAEPHIHGIRSTGARKDDDIWTGDVVEVFLSIGEAPRPYRHFIVNPQNVQWDGESGEEGDNSAWDAVWRSAVRVGQEEWTVEMAVPWEALGGLPEPGALRRANLCRQRTQNRELSTWSTVVRLFLEAEHFGIWRFERSPQD